MVADVGTFNFTGQDATFAYARGISADTGQIVLSGQDAALYKPTFSNKGRGRVGLAALDGAPRVGDATVTHAARVGGRVLRRRS